MQHWSPLFLSNKIGDKFFLNCVYFISDHPTFCLLFKTYVIIKKNLCIYWSKHYQYYPSKSLRCTSSLFGKGGTDKLFNRTQKPQPKGIEIYLPACTTHVLHMSSEGCTPESQNTPSEAKWTFKAGNENIFALVGWFLHSRKQSIQSK